MRARKLQVDAWFVIELGAVSAAFAEVIDSISRPKSGHICFITADECMNIQTSMPTIDSIGTLVRLR